MDKKRLLLRAAGVVAAALLATGLLFCLVFYMIQSGIRETITLPEGPLPAAAGQDAEPARTLFVEVNRENIQDILATMRRPDAYHQTVTAATLWPGGSASRTVDLWRSGPLSRAQVSGAGRTKHILSDGQSVWIWYEGDETARALSPDESVSFDDLAGVPAYESTASLDLTRVEDAGFVTMNGASCLYLSNRDGEYVERRWIDTATQLLTRADALEDSQLTYQLRQTACEVLTVDDPSLAERFRLPDGTDISH